MINYLLLVTPTVASWQVPAFFCLTSGERVGLAAPHLRRHVVRGADLRVGKGQVQACLQEAAARRRWGSMAARCSQKAASLQVPLPACCEGPLCGPLWPHTMAPAQRMYLPSRATAAGQAGTTVSRSCPCCAPWFWQTLGPAAVRCPGLQSSPCPPTSPAGLPASGPCTAARRWGSRRQQQAQLQAIKSQRLLACCQPCGIGLLYTVR